MVAQAFNWTGLLLSLVTIPLYLQWLGQERYGLLLTGLAFASYLMFSDAGLTWGSMLLICIHSGIFGGVTSSHVAPASRETWINPSSDPVQNTPGSCGLSMALKMVA